MCLNSTVNFFVTHKENLENIDVSAMRKVTCDFKFRIGGAGLDITA